MEITKTKFSFLNWELRITSLTPNAVNVLN